ncbi:FAD-dependent monooxygenase [Sphingomonas aracearum]|uniref:FAD-binding monooxygenase n=1 Tax=Sphingomonas aracearum TaxID=2283317 RepID=A0A369VSW9_9SPHN|nr:FAD-dependent monooxygenase [Sphingomonas aracearum]RDE04637.1 FAD-binding monooxygenase [Sphingomonas aracearum]
MRRTPALIVGGGPAGATTALLLARAGLPHLLVERNAEPGDAVCGGFLSWRSLDTLAKLGIPAEALNPEPIGQVALFAGRRVARAPLPRRGLAVSRRRLDTLLQRHARAAGAAIEIGHVREAQPGRVRLADGEIEAGALFLATGKHDLRGLARPAAARGGDPALGLRVRLPAVPALRRLVAGTVELHLFDRGYAGLAVQEDGTTNLCMAVHRSRLAEAGSPEALLAALEREAPALGERLAFRTGEPIDAVANVPYGWRAREGVAGLYRLGDQAGVIPSLAGEGMGIALASAARAVAAHRSGAGAVRYQEALARDLRRPLGLAGLVRDAAERPLTAAALTAAVRLAPALATFVAHATRIGHPPLDKGGG